SISIFYTYVASLTRLSFLSLLDALPIYRRGRPVRRGQQWGQMPRAGQRHPAVRRVQHCVPDRGHPAGLEVEDVAAEPGQRVGRRSEEHTSELQSRENLVCRLLLAKNKSP